MARSNSVGISAWQESCLYYAEPKIALLVDRDCHVDGRFDIALLNSQKQLAQGKTIVTYVPPFAFLKQKYKIMATSDRDRINLTYADFIEITKSLLRAAAVDEPWYLREYPDVADGVKTGIFKSARHHFVENGYLEGRRPCEFEVDAEWYLQRYPDVADGVSSGTINSAEEHFARDGYAEGRLPSEL